MQNVGLTQDTDRGSAPLCWSYSGKKVGSDQRDPSKVMAYPPASAAAQNVVVGHDTDTIDP